MTRLTATPEDDLLTGWRRAHFRPALTAHGWRTPVQGDGAGFPDLILLRGSRLVVWELKSASGKATPEQSAWLAAFRAAGAETRIARPADFDDLVAVLR